MTTCLKIVGALDTYITYACFLVNAFPTCPSQSLSAALSLLKWSTALFNGLVECGTNSQIGTILCGHNNIIIIILCTQPGLEHIILFRNICEGLGTRGHFCGVLSCLGLNGCRILVHIYFAQKLMVDKN